MWFRLKPPEGRNNGKNAENAVSRTIETASTGHGEGDQTRRAVHSRHPCPSSLRPIAEQRDPDSAGRPGTDTSGNAVHTTRVMNLAVPSRVSGDSMVATGFNRWFQTATGLERHRRDSCRRAAAL